MADEQAAPPVPRKISLKTVLVVAGLLVAEAAMIVAAMIIFAGDPEVATAEAVLDAAVTDEDKIVEVLVLDAKLPNAKSGVAYLYSTEIYVQVRNRHEAVVTSKVQQFYNEIKAEITAIWRTSEPHHFQEPKLENLTRKVQALLGQRFGTDAETGDPVITKCVVVMGTGFRVDR